MIDASYDRAPVTLVFADEREARAGWERAILAAGGRVGAALPLADGPRRLAEQGAMAAVVIAIDASNAQEALLERALADSAAGRYGLIVEAELIAVDALYFRVSESAGRLVCEADEAGRGIALAEAWTRPGMLLHEGGVPARAERLRALADETAGIARSLAGMAEAAAHAAAEEQAPAREMDAPAIRGIIRARRLRDRFFAGALFADPAWDMLLDLMAARLEGRTVSVSSLCIAAAVPPTTALRWIQALVEGGLFERRADPMDGRRAFVVLSDAGAQAMSGYLEARAAGG